MGRRKNYSQICFWMLTGYSVKDELDIRGKRGEGIKNASAKQVLETQQGQMRRKARLKTRTGVQVSRG